MKIVLASRNRKKIGELRTLLSKYIADIEILSLDDVGILGEIEEDGTTFEENALIKARVAATSGYIGVGDDSGLTVDALDGAPVSIRLAMPQDAILRAITTTRAITKCFSKILRMFPMRHAEARLYAPLAVFFPTGES